MIADSIGPFLPWTYLIGMLVSVFVIRARASIGLGGRPKVWGADGFGPVWTVTSIVFSMAWPITLAVWLIRGCPEPRVVFNEKAIERQRRQARESSR